MAKWPLPLAAVDRAGLTGIFVITLILALPTAAGDTLSPVQAELIAHFPWAAEVSKSAPGQADAPSSGDSDYPLSVFATRVVRSGRLPTWSPFSAGGLPVAELGVGGAMYPPRLLAMLTLDPARQHDSMLLVHALAAGLGMYAFLRVSGIGALSALLGSLAWELSPGAGQGGGQEAVAVCAAWLPIGLFCTTLAVRRRSLAWSVSAGVTVGLSVLSGAGSYAYATGLIAVGWYAALVARTPASDTVPPRWRLARALPLLASMVLGALGMGAAVWLPTLKGLFVAQLQPVSATPPMQPIDWSAVLQILMHPEFVAGDTAVTAGLARLAFIGQPVLVLACVGILVPSFHRGLGLVVAFAAFGVIATEQLAEHGHPLLSNTWLGIIGAIDGGLGLFLLTFAMAIFGAVGLGWLSDRSRGQIRHLALRAGITLVLVEAGQLLTYDWALHPGQPMQAGSSYPDSALVETVEALSQSQRVLTVAPMFDGEMPAALGIRGMSSRQTWLPNYASAVQQGAAQSTGGVDSVNSPVGGLNLYLLENLSVGLVVTPPGFVPQDSDGRDAIGTGQLRLVSRESDGWVFQDTRALPRVFLAPALKTIPDPQTALHTLLDSDFDPRNEALLIGRVPAEVNAVLQLGIAEISPGLRVSPNPVPLGTSHVIVNWHVPDSAPAEVWVAQDGGAEQLMARGSDGSQAVDWIAAGSTYVFRLYANAEKTAVLATQSVAREETLARNADRSEVRPLLEVSPNPVPLGSSRATVSWLLPGDGVGEVWVSQDAGPEVLMARGTTGSETVNWLAAGAQYIFRLYTGEDRAALVAQTTVERGRAAPRAGPTVPDVQLPADMTASQSSARITRDDLDLVEAEIDAPAASVMVLNDTWYPGWHVEVDGVEQSLLRVNYAFRGVVVQPGHHQVIFTYRPLLFYAGIAASCCTVTIATLLAVLRIRRVGRT